MSLNANAVVASMYKNNTAEVDKNKAAENTKNSSNYGKTVGEPELSEKAAKYYDQLKRKYGNYEFILVSEEEKANAEANAGKYANSVKTVVLIDEDKIERMATDESYRKKYEGILSGATAQLEQLKSSMEKSGANVKGYGMQINDNGTASYFAVLKKASSAQKERIEKNAEKKREAKKEADRIEAKKRRDERIKKSADERTSKINDADNDETVTITANSIEELMDKMNDFVFDERSNNVQTDSEKMVGQHIDFRG